MPKRLLVIDPIPTHRIRLKAALRAAQYDIASVDRIACASGAVASAPPDLIILNTSGIDPSNVMGRLRQALGPGHAPVLCRDDAAGPLRRMKALSTGARDMVATRVPDALLLARLRGILRDHEAEAELERRKVAAASFGFREAPASFESAGQIALVSVGGSQILPDLGEVVGASRTTSVSVAGLMRGDELPQAPAAIVLFADNRDVDALDSILPELRMRSHLRRTSVLVVYPEACHPIAVRALNLGAADVAEDDSTRTELSVRIEAMLTRNKVRGTLRYSAEESLKLATTDELTGLYNRRYAEVYLTDILTRARESGRGFTVMMMDIDHFKAVNDRLGHAAGDAVLRDVAKRIRDNLRAVDLVSRHGGEEFLIVLPDIDGSEAVVAADRLRKTVSEAPIQLANGDNVSVTVSVGVAVASPEWASVAHRISQTSVQFGNSDTGDPRIAALLAQADRALYDAKAACRDCVTISPGAASAV